MKETIKMAIFLEDDVDELSSGIGTRRHPGLLGVGVAFLVVLLSALGIMGPHGLGSAVGEATSKALNIHRPITMLEHSGVVLLNTSNLKNHISLPIHGNHHRYWIGPIAGSIYTTNCVTPGLLIVGYIRANSTLPNATLIDGVQPFVTVKAYDNQRIYDGQVQSLTLAPLTTVTDSLGNVVSYNPASVTRLLIRPKGSDAIITIKYSTPQSVASALIDAQNLVKL